MAISLPKTKAPAAFCTLPIFTVSLGAAALFLLAASLDSLLLTSNRIGSVSYELLLGTSHSTKPSPVTTVSFLWRQPFERGSSIEVRSSISSGSTSITNGTMEMDVGGASLSGKNESENNSSHVLASSNQTEEAAPLPSPPSSTFLKDELRDCDLYHGKWIYDSAGPLYRNNTCPIIVKSMNCQGNGRPDTGYENWRWRPNQCELPRFDARKFLELLKGNTLAFIGDSLARNQMESMLCILWQVEEPRRLSHPWIHKWHFKSTNTTIARIWSAWLVNTTTGPLPSTPPDLLKIHLDTPDDNVMRSISEFDIVVLSSGHWFFKQSAYILKGNVVGGQLWSPKTRLPKKQQQVDNFVAFGIAMKTALTAIATLPYYKGLTIVRSYSPDHYAGGEWNTDGWCGKMSASKLLVDRVRRMHGEQAEGFERAVEKLRNGSKMRLMDITEAFEYRHDGHPGPYYESFDLDTRRRTGAEPPSKDCGHWCLPGPVDTWNEILFEVIRRELRGEHAED